MATALKIGVLTALGAGVLALLAPSAAHADRAKSFVFDVPLSRRFR